MFNDAIDDQPHSQQALGFEGVDMVTPPAQLPPGLLSDAINIICDGDGLAKSRPALKLNAFLSGTTVGGSYGYNGYTIVRGLCYYDLPDYEGTICHQDGKILAIPSAANVATPTGVFAPLSFNATPVDTVQMIDTLYYLLDGFLCWTKYTGGVWTNGLVTTFSSGAAMPAWSRIVSQGFRLLLMEANGYKLYASAIGAAALPANWVSTDNIRVGTGTGDPARGLVASQGGFVTMLNAQSVYQIDVSNPTVANWSGLRVTSAVGCVEGRTAVAFGQDVYFLARPGVVSLGSLTDTLSLAPSATLSAPLQPIIDRINWTYISTAFATSWRELYLLAVPLDSDTRPKHLLAFHTRLKRWMGIWDFTTAVAATQPNADNVSFAGFTCGTVCNFGDKAETLLADNTGRVLRIDATAVADAWYNGGATAFYSIIVTRAFAHDAVDCLKQPMLLEFEQVDALSTAVFSFYLPDDAPTQTIATYANWPTYRIANGAAYDPAAGVDRKRYSLRNYARNRDARAELYSVNASGGLRLRAVKSTAYIDPPQLTV